MKSILFVVVAMMLYALSNVLLEQKFSKYNTFTLMVCYVSVILVVAVIGRQTTLSGDESFNFPQGAEFALVILLGLIMATADYLYVAAYASGGDLMTISSIVVMFPVFASIVKFAMTRELPNAYQIVGYTFAVVAVLCVSKGATVK
jgi:drug/metabolite transporter (DMT)-like permease